MMTKYKLLFLFYALLFISTSNGFSQASSSVKQQENAAGPEKNAIIYSPNHETMFEIGLNGTKSLQYRTTFLGREVISWSPLGLTVNDTEIGKNVSIQSKSGQNVAENISWNLGENSTIKNSYSELNIACLSGSIAYTLKVRVFDGSIAFRYQLPKQDQQPKQNMVISKENTQFNFTEPYQIYQYHHESVFTPCKIDSLATTSDLPSTLTNGKLYMTVGEAANANYTKAELGRGIVPGSLSIAFARDSAVKSSFPFQTPWRTVGFSQTAIGLHAFSELPMKLNDQPYATVPAWIKPGKVMRSELNTQSAIDCINLAKKLNFQYIMFDAGWYGPERAVSSDPSVPITAIDMAKVIRYGKDNGVGVILYVNYVGLKNHLDKILPLYKKWGVSGLKFGFIDGFTQGGMNWLSSAIKKGNDAGLFLNIHDNYKPTGLSRTYPALLTQEGIRGDENSPDAYHTTVLPFTRFLAGAADFTFCFPNPKNNFGKNLKVSKAQQLALTVIYFSPLQSIFWYGRPNDYTNWDEIEFFKYVPTTWDESRYLKGEIGENISVARCKDKVWYVGNAAGPGDWKSSLTLDFLEYGKKYKATIYEDAGGSIVKRTADLKRGDVFPFEIKAKGGLAMIIRLEQIPVSKKKRVFVHPGILHTKLHHLTGYLSKLDYKNIAFVMPDSDQSQMRDRQAAYNDAIAANQLLPLIKKIPFANDPDQTVKDLVKFIKKHPEIDAIFFATNYLAFSGIKCLNQLKLKIPDDVAIVAFDDHDVFNIYSPTITAVAQPINELARESIRILLDELRGGKINRTARKMVVQAKLIVRDSTTK